MDRHPLFERSFLCCDYLVSIELFLLVEDVGVAVFEDELAGLVGISIACVH